MWWSLSEKISSIGSAVLLVGLEKKKKKKQKKTNRRTYTIWMLYTLRFADRRAGGLKITQKWNRVLLLIAIVQVRGTILLFDSLPEHIRSFACLSLFEHDFKFLSFTQRFPNFCALKLCWHFQQSVIQYRVDYWVLRYRVSFIALVYWVFTAECFQINTEFFWCVASGGSSSFVCIHSDKYTYKHDILWKSQTKLLSEYATFRHYRV